MRYQEQHARFVAELRKHVPNVIALADLVGDHPALARTAGRPNQVFTRDSLVTLPWAPEAYVRARMRPPQRRAESRTLEAAVQRLGLRELVRLPAHTFLEGGDVVPFSLGGRRTLLVGHGPRSSRAALRFLARALIPEHADELIAIRLADCRLNLDGGLLPVAEDVVIAHRESVREAALFDAAGERPLELWALFRSHGVRVIEAMLEESIHAQACNCVCLGGRRVICYDLCDRVARLLERAGIEVYCVPGSELVKGRGGPRCMSRPIYSAHAFRAGA
jgi:N-dimethylarginine dimethylaminohydrolase